MTVKGYRGCSFSFLDPVLHEKEYLPVTQAPQGEPPGSFIALFAQRSEEEKTRHIRHEAF